MNIVQINTTDTRGGAAKIAFTLTKSLRARGDNLSLFVKQKDSQDTDVHTIKKPTLFGTILNKDIGSIIENRLRPLLANDSEGFNINGLLHSRELATADIVHCHNLHGNYFNLNTLPKLSEKRPVIWTLHDMWAITAHCAHTRNQSLEDGFYVCENLRDYQELKWNNEQHLRSVKRSAYNNSRLEIVTPCKWLAEKVRVSALGSHPVTVIPNGIDTNIFAPLNTLTCKAATGLHAYAQIVLVSSAIGRSREKGWDIIEHVARHFKKNPSVHFLAVGLSKNTDLPPNVTAVPFTSNETLLAQYYNASDLLLFPSQKETLPLTILEAMACGKPVVSSDVGGVKEIIDTGTNGYCVPADAPWTTYVKHIESILSMTTEAREQLSKLCREKIVQSFSLNNMVNQYRKLYERVINNQIP